MNKQHLLLCTICVSLTGCSFVPSYQRAPLPTAATYPGECTSGTSTDIDQLPWQDFFTDPDLQELICLALENNRDLTIAIQRVMEDRSLYGIRQADLFPNINGVLSDIRLRLLADLSPTGASQIIDIYQSTLNLTSWEIDFWGRLRSLTEVARQNYLATEEAQRAVIVSLIRQIANTYLIAETLLNQARSDWIVLKRLRQQNWNAMTLLVGAPIQPIERSLTQVEPYFFREIEPGLPSNAVNLKKIIA